MVSQLWCTCLTHSQSTQSWLNKPNFVLKTKTQELPYRYQVQVLTLNWLNLLIETGPKTQETKEQQNIHIKTWPRTSGTQGHCLIPKGENCCRRLCRILSTVLPSSYRFFYGCIIPCYMISHNPCPFNSLTFGLKNKKGNLKVAVGGQLVCILLISFFTFDIISSKKYRSN